MIWRFGLTWGALLLDNLNLFQAFSQLRQRQNMQTLFSALNVESGYNELNTCSTYSNCILAVLATAKGMGQYSDDPSTRSPYVAFGLSSLFPQTGGATSTQINDLFCLPTSLRRRMVEFSRTRSRWIKDGQILQDNKAFLPSNLPRKIGRIVENTDKT